MPVEVHRFRRKAMAPQRAVAGGGSGGPRSVFRRTCLWSVLQPGWGQPAIGWLLISTVDMWDPAESSGA